MTARHGQSWVVPMSAGRHYRRTRLGAWWACWRWNRQWVRYEAARPDLAGLRTRWETRRVTRGRE